ncbi:MAG: ABC transporter substrate-binding protein, partial [Nonomuraea sp.]|nr:ABC transporter substrate-binding protein [Nonomuraea sp.]
MGVRSRQLLAGAALVWLTSSVTACTSDRPALPPAASGSTASGDQGTGAQSKFFVRADYDAQMAMRSQRPAGPADRPWEQSIEPRFVDTAAYKKAGPYHLCFSNAAVDNPWRQVGWKTMQAEVALHKEITSFTALDAEGK